MPSQYSEIKNMLQKCPETEKKFGLNRDLNPQLCWLATVLSTWFWQEFTTANDSCIVPALPLVPVAAYISYDITYAWALQYVWSVYGV